jgi:hypothetical protein
MKKNKLADYFRSRKLLIAGFILCISLTVSCTQNQRAKSLGGKATYELPKGLKLVVVTWKGENIWYLTRPMKENETAETYTFQEGSSYGKIRHSRKRNLKNQREKIDEDSLSYHKSSCTPANTS